MKTLEQSKFINRSKLSRKARTIVDEIESYGYYVYTVPAHFAYYSDLESHGFKISKHLKNGREVTEIDYIELGVTFQRVKFEYINDKNEIISFFEKIVVISTGAIRIWQKIYGKYPAMLDVLSHELTHIRLFEDKFNKAVISPSAVGITYYDHDLRFMESYTKVCNDYNIKYKDSNYYLD